MTRQRGTTAMKCKHGHGYLQHVHGAAPEDTMPTGGIDAACNNCTEEVRNEEMPSGKQIGHAHSHIHTLGCATDTPAPHSHRNQPFLVLHLPSTSTRQSRKSNISISTMSAILGFCWVLPTDMLQTQAHVGHGFVLRQISAKRPGTSLSMCCGCQSCLKRLGCLFLASVQPLSRGKAQNRGRPSASRERTQLVPQTHPPRSAGSTEHARSRVVPTPSGTAAQLGSWGQIPFVARGVRCLCMALAPGRPKGISGRRARSSFGRPPATRRRWRNRS